MKKWIIAATALLSSLNLIADGLVVKVQSEFYSCQQIKDLGFSTGSGNYDINLFGVRTTVYCDMTNASSGVTEVPFSLDLLDREDITITSDLTLNASYNNGILANLTMDDNDILVYKYLRDNNLLDLVQFTTKAYRNGNTSDVKNGDLILRLNGSTITRDYRDPIPENIKTGIDAVVADTGIEPLGLIYARLSSRTAGSDRDTSRMYFDIRDSLGAAFPSTVADTGQGNWSGTPNYVRYLRSVPADSTTLRFYGQCRRYTGTQCSADVLDYTFVLFPDLPQVGQMVRIEIVLPRNQ